MSTQKISSVMYNDAGLYVTYENVDVEVYNEEAGEDEVITANMVLKLTDEGMVIDITDPKTGEVIKSAWQLVDDFVQMTH